MHRSFYTVALPATFRQAGDISRFIKVKKLNSSPFLFRGGSNKLHPVFTAYFFLSLLGKNQACKKRQLLS
jgi:hypothetical protein